VIAIIGTVGVPACYGGFETLVDNLLENEGEYTVYCSSKSYRSKLKVYKSAKLVYLPLNANGVSSVLYDALAIVHALLNRSRVLVILGVSGGFMLPFVRLFTRSRLVTNIDGLEWRRDKWNKLARVYLKWSEKLAVKYSHVVIADNQGIADYVQNEYGVKAEVIAYGGDHVLAGTLAGKSADYAFGVCRIEPENNIHIILEAFRIAGLPLKFVGNWAASEYGRKLKSVYSVVDNIELVDPIYDLSTLFELRSACRFYVHGHSAGGTNPSLVEAMFFSKMILAYDCVYNRYTMRNHGCYFSDVGSLVKLLGSLDDSHLQRGGADLLEIAHESYTWQSVRDRYLSVTRD
jgi:glycosyltransferase involved in cell wall biosynthesis